MTPELVLLSLGGLCYLGLLLLSGVICVKALMRLADKQPVLPPKFRCSAAYVPPFVFGLAIVYLSMGLSQFLPKRANDPLPEIDFVTLLNASITEGILVTLVFAAGLVSLTQSQPELIRLGFRTDDLKQQAQDGLYGFVAALVPVYSVILLSIPLRSLETSHPFLQLLNEQGVGSEFIGIVLAAVVLAPLKEELIFRVVLQSTLVRWWGKWLGIVITALVFSAVHGFPDSLGLFPLALILGYVYQQRRSFLSVVLLHALFNAFNISLLFLQKLAESVTPSTALIP